uniref:Uncharacterized protein n=1 Tax=Steinernema glaseri TaxID=37863 RepID=A0A1I7Z8A5_9BILA
MGECKPGAGTLLPRCPYASVLMRLADAISQLSVYVPFPLSLLFLSPKTKNQCRRPERRLGILTFDFAEGIPNSWRELDNRELKCRVFGLGYPNIPERRITKI